MIREAFGNDLPILRHFIRARVPLVRRCCCDVGTKSAARKIGRAIRRVRVGAGRVDGRHSSACVCPTAAWKRFRLYFFDTTEFRSRGKRSDEQAAYFGL